MAVDERETITRTKFVRRWIWATLLGYLAGVCAGFAMSIAIVGISTQFPHLSQTLPNNPLLAFLWDVVGYLFLLIVGAAVGLVQWNLAPSFNVSRRAWITANMTACVFMFALLNIFLPTSSFDLFRLVESESRRSALWVSSTISPTWPAAVCFLSGLVGVGVGFPQAFVLRKAGYKSLLVLPAKMLGVALVLLMFLLLVGRSDMDNDMISLSLMCCLGPMVFAAISGWSIYQIQHRNKGE